VGGVVTVEGKPVQATILSNGVASSTGIVTIEDDKVTYIPYTTQDLEYTIEQLIAITQQLVLTLTAIGAAMTGPTTAPPPSLPADLISLTAKATLLTTKKAALK
jgi:hypothetical protein